MISGDDRAPAATDALGVSAASSLDELLDEFEAAWQRGERPRADLYLPRATSDDDAVALIYHEYCLAASEGKRAEVGTFLERYAEYRGRLERLFGLRSLLALGGDAQSAEPAPAAWPEPGDTIGPFRLVRGLGVGAFARVFLAEQVDLADRLVVVKVSQRASAEPRLLARARHPHIVEVLRHATTDDGALHLVCMPYLGGAPLSAVLQALAEAHATRQPRGGKALLAALDRVAAPEESEVARTSAVRQIVRGQSYTGAVCWIVARLAEALDTAHGRGVLHGDLKPSNVLIASDGRPLLLDLNLAIECDQSGADELGGTPAYMSPERLARLARPVQRGTNGSLDRAALRKSDIYSLGLVLHEALVLEPPRTAEAVAHESPRQFCARLAADRAAPSYATELAAHRRVPAGIRPILHRCLDADLAKRYGTAGELAEDLGRHLAHRPLRHAAEPVGGYRAVRPFRRHARLTAACVFLLCAMGVAGWLARQSVLAAQRRAALEKLDALWSAREPGVFRFEWVGSWRQEDPVEVGEIAQRVLDQFAALGSTGWRLRAEYAALPEAQRLDLELWLLEHLWKYARVLSEREDREQSRRALELLERDSRWANLAPFATERARLRAALGEPARVATGEVEPLLDAYARGVALEPRHARRARAAFEESARYAPDSFWINYRLAACECRLGRYSDAAARLKVCLRVQPQNAALWTQLAACLLEAGRDEEAKRACDRALALAPDSIDAIHTRALLQAWGGEVAGVEKSLEHFAWLSGRVHALKRWDLLVLIDYALRRGEPHRPESGAEPQLAGSEMDRAITHALRGYLHECDQRWREAVAEYDRALASNPDHVWVLYRRGQVYARMHDRRGIDDCWALIAHDRAEELFGQVPVALRVYGVLLSGIGHEVARAADSAERAALQRRALQLAGAGLEQARLAGDRGAIVEMELQTARMLVLSIDDAVEAAARIAPHVRAAYRLDAELTARILANDRTFSLRPGLPEWVPPYDPARATYPYQREEDRAAGTARSSITESE